MKVARVEVHSLCGVLDEPFGWSQRWTDRRSVVAVKVVDDEGTCGWGESVDAQAIVALAPLLIGEDPRHTERLWQRMYLSGYQDHGFAGTRMSAISALDMALHDLRGKIEGRSVSELLGGASQARLQVYATGLYYRVDDFPDALEREAIGYAEAGFTGMKMKIGGKPLAEDVRRVRHLRRVLGDDMHLMVDANEGYDERTAIQAARRLADTNLSWFEEPCGSYADEANLAVRAAAPMPVSGGESLKSRWEFAPRLARRVFDIIQPDIVFAGGVSEMFKILHMANAHGIQVHPHFWGTGISLAATLHVTATMPPCPPAHAPEPYAQAPVVELDSTPHPVRENLTDPLFRADHSSLAVPTGPGLGVQVQEDALLRFRVAPVQVVEEAASGLRHER